MIDYEEIDILCIPMVKFFNDVGLETEFSCEGHSGKFINNFQITFSGGVTDKDIQLFLSKLSRSHTPLLGRFLKWTRKIDGHFVSNWEYLLGYDDETINHTFSRADLETMKNVHKITIL